MWRFVAILEALGLFVLLRTVLLSDRGSVGRGGATALIFIVLLLLLGTVQLLPMPADVWPALPGRGLLADALRVVDRESAAWPISLSPADTRLSLLAFLPPVALFVAVLHLGLEERAMLVRVAIACGVLSALLGFVQVAAGDGSFFPYRLPPYDRVPGLFSNYNHQALFLSCLIVLAAVVGLGRGRDGTAAARIGRGALLLLLALGALVTSSRSGLLLLVLSMVAAVLLPTGGIAALRGRWQPRTRWMIVGLGIAAILAVVILLSDSYRWGVMQARFETVGDDARFRFWPNVLYVIDLYFPFGAGFGTFDMVYQSAEPLNDLGPAIVNHAHNEYLEFVIEAGAPAIALMALFFAWFVWRAAAAWRMPRSAPGAMLARAATIVILFVLLHALVDYAIRTEAVACLFALACGLLVPPAIVPVTVRTANSSAARSTTDEFV